ncbi:MAG: chromosomal replication initiator protein DnaA [Gracilibacteraceae bacterium]|jgi:chromosomal replication initiator protein|nr:chromosomal replication initiator protein DnaA [Gracilibacteraceae bacterium]
MEEKATVRDGVTKIADGAFANCETLESITIPGSVTSIGDGAFFCCENLTNIDVPASVTHIGDSAFFHCHSLTNISISAPLTSIGKNAFAHCVNLKKIDIPSTVKSIGDCAFFGCEKMANISIPNSVTSIGDSAFWNCRDLTEIVIPAGVTSIGTRAFDARYLRKIVVAEGSACYTTRDGVLFTKNMKTLLFYPQSRKASLYVVPPGVTRIGDDVFAGCGTLRNASTADGAGNLINVVLPDSLTSIGDGAFEDCYDLETVVIPDSVTSISNRAFLGCDRLTEIAVSAGVISTGESAFAKYTFQNFIVGEGNRFAYAAALAVAECSAEACNPLFIYGGNGLGKTHLMHAVAHKISQTRPHFKTVCTTAEQFTNEMIDSIRHEKQAAFRDTYRKLDMLLIDNIQFLAGREATQMEFFYTLNALYEAGKQIIISSDMRPSDIPRLAERLRSRFEGGLTVYIAPPDYETRMAVLRAKTRQGGSAVPDDVLDLIASSIRGSVRDLEGALNKLAAYCSFTGEKPELEMARRVLRDLMPQDQPVTAETIMNAVAGRYSLTPDDLRQNKRSSLTPLPRQIAMYLCRDLTELSLPQIGEAFGGRDHSTVIHAVNKIREMKEKDAALEKMLQELTAEIKFT